MTKLEELTSWDGELSLTIPPFETDSPCVRREAVKEAGFGSSHEGACLAMGNIQGVWPEKPQRRRSQLGDSVSVNIANDWNVKQ